MSNIDKIEYSLFKVSNGTYSEMLDRLFSYAVCQHKILRLVFFCGICNNSEYILKESLLRKKAKNIWGDELPVITLVPQKPLDSDITLEIHSYKSDSYDLIEYKSYKENPYVIVENECGRFLYAGGLHSSYDKDMYMQSVDVLETLGGILSKEGFPVNSIVRQWNYIENITSFDSKGNQHYQMFNNARSKFYSKTKWDNGYPAATGIGTFGGGIIVDVDAVVGKDGFISITPIDNKLQVAAHSYSDSVLEQDVNGKTTPKFERAKSLDINGKRIVYISGTAAIRGEESLYDVGIVRQLEVTLENIRQLTGNSKVKLIRVYLKEKSFYDKVKKILSEENVMVSYLLSEVCRDELLIEIEGIALEL